MTSLYHTEKKLQSKIGQKVSQPIVGDDAKPVIHSKSRQVSDKLPRKPPHFAKKCGKQKRPANADP